MSQTDRRIAELEQRLHRPGPRRPELEILAAMSIGELRALEQVIDTPGHPLIEALAAAARARMAGHEVAPLCPD